MLRGFGEGSPVDIREASCVSLQSRGGHAVRDEQALTFRRRSNPAAGWRKLCG